tara:strand:- start:1563 stop:2516 length:954 start_codon:yes stop_codon:yes gene_type:complete
MSLSPIVIFGFNRPEHMRRMLESLRNNPESRNSKVIFYIDGFDNENDELIEKTLEIVKEDWGFTDKVVNFRDRNYGCKFNIINGITEVFKDFESLIVLEDDLILGKNFLNFMNTSIEKYESSNKVWAISGWGHPQLVNLKKGSSFSSLTSPWGWATWKSKWNIFIENKLYEINLISELNDKEKNQFLFYGYADYWEEAIIKDLDGENSVWDAYWYQTIYINGGLTLFPNTSHVQNEGFDGSGIHCKENDLFFTPLNNKKTEIFPKNIKLSEIYKLNTFFFFLNYRRKQYFEYHKDKFSSFKNLKLFILKKIKSKLPK